jgi:pimeloyl-ACP methyl ester carboxylesterase
MTSPFDAVQWRKVCERGDLAAWTTGDGPVLLAAHGIEDGWRSWTQVASRLADRYRVIALDLPWRSGNDYRWHADGTPGTWLARALELVDEPDHQLLGHSFGATASLELLADRRRQGHRPTAAALVAPFYRPAHMCPDSVREQSRAALRTTIRTGLRVGLGGRDVEPDVLAIMESGLEDHLMPTVFPVFFDYFADSADLELSGVDIPVLVTAGTTDPSLTPDRAAALGAALPAATVHTHEHYTHFCHLEQAADVAAEVADFLTTHSLTVGGQAR